MSAKPRANGDLHQVITIVVVDHRPMSRAMLTQLLSGDGLEVVGEADNAQDAVELVLDLRPDVVVMDIGLPGDGGVRAITQLGLRAPASRVLILPDGEQNSVVDAIVAGAIGCVLKSAPTAEINAAVIATAAGYAVLPSQIAGKLLHRIRDLDMPISTGRNDGTAIRAALTERELEIFTLLASGDTNQQIGRELGLSANTIANHITSILAKLHLENRIQAAVQAVRSGIS